MRASVKRSIYWAKDVFCPRAIIFFQSINNHTPTKKITGEIERDLTAVQFYPSCRDNEWKDFNALMPRESKPDLSEKKFELRGI